MRYLWLTMLAPAALFGLWHVWPSPFDPEFWDEPEPPAMTGVLEPRGRLAAAEILAEGLVHSSEGIALAPDGAVYASQPDGSLVRVRLAGGEARVETVAQVTAAPGLGLQWLADGRLGAAFSDGLYAVDVRTGAVELLANAHDGLRFGFANDLDVAADGTIYFTDSSWRWPNEVPAQSFIFDMVENRAYGRLLAHDPHSGETRQLLDGLYYPNGVALAADGRSLFFVETFRYRLNRYWLSGPRAGELERVAENLPGIPDGLRADGAGNLYIGMDTQRVPLLRFLHRNPYWARMITKLPRAIWLRAGPPRGLILKLTEDGEYLDSWHDPDGRFGYIANVVPADDGTLWIGSLTNPVIGRFRPEGDAD